jgi:hypothetical protein
MAVSDDPAAARASLEAAYLRTTYRVTGPSGPVDIRIGVHNSALDRLLETHQVREWAFVTASNPRSRACSQSENSRRNAGLEQDLQKAGLQYLPGSGVPDEPGWKAEHSFLVLGITKSVALAMAKRRGQVAIVWGTLGNAAELVWSD